MVSRLRYVPAHIRLEWLIAWFYHRFITVLANWRVAQNYWMLLMAGT